MWIFFSQFFFSKMYAENVFSPRVTIMRDKHSRRSRGVAFVAFSSAEAAQACVSNTHETVLAGRTLQVNQMLKFIPNVSEAAAIRPFFIIFCFAHCTDEGQNPEVEIIVCSWNNENYDELTWNYCKWISCIVFFTFLQAHIARDNGKGAGFSARREYPDKSRWVYNTAFRLV